MAAILTEALVCYKYSADSTHIADTPTPLYIAIPWIGSILYLIVGYLYLRFKPDRTVKYPGVFDEVDQASTSRKRKTSPNKTPGKTTGKKHKTH